MQGLSSETQQLESVFIFALLVVVFRSFALTEAPDLIALVFLAVLTLAMFGLPLLIAILDAITDRWRSDARDCRGETSSRRGRSPDS
jgi:hypothetical protein